MSADAGRRRGDKEIAETAAPALNHGGLDERDVEEGPEMVDVDRIEKVYRYVQ